MKTIYWLVSLFLMTFFWSIYQPREYFTCFLEIIPALLGFFILALTFNKFRLTNLTYSLILVHCVILFVGGHYTYAEVPLFEYLKEVFHQSRNNYDKVGHFAQGFVPALITREIFIRKNVIANKAFFNFVIVSICLAISAAYEWIEWTISIVSGDQGDAFLGTQGYIWDTQSDMLFATIGACFGLLFFSRLQDQQLTALRFQSK